MFFYYFTSLTSSHWDLESIILQGVSSSIHTNLWHYKVRGMIWDYESYFEADHYDFVVGMIM